MIHPIPRAFYSDIETNDWLFELISSGHIMSGAVSRASISDLTASDLSGYTRVHLFAGIGGWDLALRMAEWPDDVPVWTGSCPCQPFSSAGKQQGTKDERHLWPEMRRLIRECAPPIIFGEQVSSRAGRKWLAGVRADLEALGYAVGAADLCAAGAGAPQIRQRLYWGAVRLGDGNSERRTWDEILLQWQWGKYKEGSRISRPSGSIPENIWSDYRVIVGADGKARRIEPGIEPLADGISNGMVHGIADSVSDEVNSTQKARTKRLSGYGNAIVPQVAETFIRAFVESI